MLVIAGVIGIALMVAVGSHFTARRWFERSNALRHRRSASGIILGAEPVELHGEGDAGILLLHGFGDTPQTLRAYAVHLHALGYGVLAPLLPGHGRTLTEFVRATASDWIEESRKALQQLNKRHSRVGIVGLSMGGAVAVILASEADEVTTLALLSPYLTMPSSIRRLAKWHRIVGWLLPYFPGRGERSIQDERAAAESLAYAALNASVLAELATTVDRASALLPSVDIPVLMIQSREDNRIAAVDAAVTFERIGSRGKKLVWITGSGHVITVDRGRDRVLTEVVSWLEETMPLKSGAVEA